MYLNKYLNSTNLKLQYNVCQIDRNTCKEKLKNEQNKYYQEQKSQSKKERAQIKKLGQASVRFSSGSFLDAMCFLKLNIYHCQ